MGIMMGIMMGVGRRMGIILERSVGKRLLLVAGGGGVGVDVIHL